MAEAPQDPTANSGPALQAFLIQAQYIKDFSFENPRAPEIYTIQTETPKVEVNVDVAARPMPQENNYEVTLQINARADSGETTLFISELTYGGIFTVSGIPEDQVQAILMVEAPRQLFPFARAIVANATRDCGFPPLIIQPLDFLKLYTDNNAALAASPGA